MFATFSVWISKQPNQSGDFVSRDAGHMVGVKFLGDQECKISLARSKILLNCRFVLPQDGPCQFFIQMADIQPTYTLKYAQCNSSKYQ